MKKRIVLLLSVLLLISVGAIGGFIAGYLIKSEQTKSIVVTLPGVISQTGLLESPNYQLTPFECSPLLGNGSCSNQIRNYYQYVIDNMKNRCLAILKDIETSTTTSAPRKIEIPKFEPTFSTTNCREFTDGSLHCYAK